jgi:hypothetical protein
LLSDFSRLTTESDAGDSSFQYLPPTLIPTVATRKPLNNASESMGEEGSAFEVYENGRPRIKSLADYHDDGESDTDPGNSDFQ